MVELPSALWLRQFIFVRELSTAIITWHIKEDRQFLQAKVVFTFISASSINNPEAVSRLLVNDRPVVSAPAPLLKWFTWSAQLQFIQQQLMLLYMFLEGLSSKSFFKLINYMMCRLIN